MKILEHKLLPHFATIKNNFSESIERFCNHISNYIAFKNLLPISSNFYNDYRVIKSLQCIFPLDVFNPDDLRVSNSLMIIEKYLINNQYILDPSNQKGISVYDNFILAHIYLKRFNSKAFDTFDWILNQSLSTGSWPDYINPQTFQGSSSGHSLKINSEFIIFFRQCVIQENKNELNLLPFIPSSWLPTSSTPLHIQNAPTEFGTISFKLSKSSFGFTFELTSTLFKSPHLITLSLPVNILKINEASVPANLNSQNIIEFKDGTISLSIYI